MITKNPPEHNQPVIETHHLVKRLASSTNNELLIIDKVDFCIHQGESVAITGTSGSGKTTLLGLLAGLDVPSSGEIRLLGKDLSTLDEDQRAALRMGKVGFVFQSFHLMDNLSALENIMLPLELNKTIQIDYNHIRQQAMQALQQVGLAKRATHLPTQLSGGEQQRVALARAFVSKPAILFADEPTGNLDKRTGEDIIKLLFSLQQQNRTTLVMVTHDDSLAMQCATRYHLEDGKLKT